MTPTARASPRTTPRRCGGCALPLTGASPVRSTTSDSCTPTVRVSPRTGIRWSASLPDSHADSQSYLVHVRPWRRCPQRRGGAVVAPCQGNARGNLGLMQIEVADYESDPHAQEDTPRRSRWYRPRRPTQGNSAARARSDTATARVARGSAQHLGSIYGVGQDVPQDYPGLDPQSMKHPALATAIEEAERQARRGTRSTTEA